MAKKAAKGGEEKGRQEALSAAEPDRGCRNDTPYFLMQTFRISGS